ncbi:MAG: DNA polymerase III subunit delta [Proteobacteria bacterium]|nr:MAG: DNA polymerase III subunit delta [Pseudomonadota bacterium]
MSNLVLGHDATAQRFANLMQKNTLPHAWLLHGLRGVGKAMLAQSLAESYLCESLTDAGRGCGQCHGCHMLAADSHPDFMQLGILWDEKKKKFNRDISVGQVRDALSFLSLSGMQSQRRVLLLDDADAMNNQAANALLKGLEEPSSGSLLLIVCHDLTRLPATIRSRCMLEHCAPLHENDMQQALQSMALSENIMPLAEQLAQGCPGHIAVLQDDDVAQACLQWSKHVSDISCADIGAMSDFLQKYIQIIPHGLMVAMLMLPLQSELQQSRTSYAKKQLLLQAAQALLAWPADVIRHSLRPAPALLSRILDMRGALKNQ